MSPYKSSLIKKVQQPEVVTLTESDVQRMKSEAAVLTAEERNSLRHAIEERKERERAAAKARKEKMLRLQAEAKQQVWPSPHWTGLLLLSLTYAARLHMLSVPQTRHRTLTPVRVLPS